MKILIAGVGKSGDRLTRQLSAEGHEIILIDKNAGRLEEAVEQYDVMAVCGDCTLMNILLQADVREADLLIVTTSADEVNLLCCMTAHYLNPDIHTIVRICNPDYSEQIYEMRKTFALSLAVNPELQAAEEIDRLLKYPGFLKREVFARSRVEIVELRVNEQSPLCNVSLNELPNIVRCHILVCTVLRDGEAMTPDGSFVLKTGDYIFVTGIPQELTKLLKNLGVITRRIKRVMLCGGGKVSYYLARRLEKSGISVKIIEKDHDRCVKLSESLEKAEIVEGDASHQPLLESEGISSYDSLITMMGIDEFNMIVSLYGKSVGIPQVITKVGHIDNGSILSSLSLDSIISPKEICAASIVRYVRAMQNTQGAALTVHPIAGGQAEALEFMVDSKTKHCGEPLKDIVTRSDVLIACITHGKETLIPSGSSSFVPGDIVIIVTHSGHDIRSLNDIFEK